MANVHTLDHEHTPVRGLPVQRDPGSSQLMSTREGTDAHAAVPSGQGQGRMPHWVFLLSLVGAGGGGGSIAAGLGALNSDDVEALERDVEVQDKRNDGQDTKLDDLRREQLGQHRWVASELIKQSRALSKIAEKVGADVDVEVEAYQSGGM